MATIYFDLDGTLLTYGEDFRALFDRAMGEELPEEVYDLYVSQILENLEEMEDTPYRKAFREVKEEFDLDFNADEVAEKYIEIEVASTEVYSSMKALLEKLSDHNIGILTNGDKKVQRMKIQKNELESYVDEILVSNEVGVRKPEARIFEIAKERLPADEFIYIGDTFDEDILPAKEAGFRTIYINGEREAELEAQNPEKLAKMLNLM